MNPIDQRWNQFLHEELASRDTIDFKKIYVDIAGDLQAGLMLSELIYWYLPDKNRKSRLRVKKDGHYWVAVRRYEWWDRTRLTPDQADRAIKILMSKGILEKAVHKFKGDPTTHVRLVKENFLPLYEQLTQNPPSNPFSPKTENKIADQQDSSGEEASWFEPDTEDELPLDRCPVTENTTKNTTKNFPDALSLDEADASSSQGHLGADALDFDTQRKNLSPLEILIVQKCGLKEKKDQSGRVYIIAPSHQKKLNQTIFYFDEQQMEQQEMSSPNEMFEEKASYREWVKQVLLVEMSNVYRPPKMFRTDDFVSRLCNYSRYLEWYKTKGAKYDELPKPAVPTMMMYDPFPPVRDEDIEEPQDPKVAPGKNPNAPARPEVPEPNWLPEDYDYDE